MLKELGFLTIKYRLVIKYQLSLIPADGFENLRPDLQGLKQTALLHNGFSRVVPGHGMKQLCLV